MSRVRSTTFRTPNPQLGTAAAAPPTGPPSTKPGGWVPPVGSPAAEAAKRKVPPPPVTSKLTEFFGDGNYRVTSSCMNGHRDSMEDAHAVSLVDAKAFIGVFDGHAGGGCASFSAKQFPEFVQAANWVMSDETLSELCTNVDKKFIQTVAADPLCSDSDAGSTAAFLIATPSDEDGMVDLHIGNIGDARVLVGNLKGECLLATIDHKPSLREETERILAAGGRVAHGKVNNLLAVSRALGDSYFKSNRTKRSFEQMVISRPNLMHTTCPCGPTEFALVCCDGLFEADMSNEQLTEWVGSRLAAGEERATVLEGLMDECLRRGSKDNMSVMLVEFTAGTTLPTRFIPGRFLTRYSPTFWKTYGEMVNLAVMDMGSCLEARASLIVSELAAATDETERALLKEEIEQYGGGPPAELEGESRTEWFEELMERWETERFSDAEREMMSAGDD